MLGSTPHTLLLSYHKPFDDDDGDGNRHHIVLIHDQSGAVVVQAVMCMRNTILRSQQKLDRVESLERITQRLFPTLTLL